MSALANTCPPRIQFFAMKELRYRLSKWDEKPVVVPATITSIEVECTVKIVPDDPYPSADEMFR